MQQNTRVTYLDWLRIIAVAGVLFLHSAQPYITEPWHIKNVQKSDLLLEFCSWLHRFRMPLLFFISGTVSYFMMQKQSAGGFIQTRLRRLGIPVLLGILIIVPPQVYIERITQGYTGNFFQFYPSVFTTGPYPSGNMSWHHLWFIVYLLIYDIVCAPLFGWLVSTRGKQWLARQTWVSRSRNVYLLIIPSVILYAAFSEQFPATSDLIHDYFFIFYWLFFVLVGFLGMAIPGIMDSLERNRRFSLTTALLSFGLITYLRWTKQHPWSNDALVSGLAAQFIYLCIAAVTAWAWVFAIIGYGKKYLNRPHRALGYINQAVYPFYILHQTVMVIISWYIVRTSDSIAMKYFFTVVLTLGISMLVYHCLIRPYYFMRVLFGGKAKKSRNEILKNNLPFNQLGQGAQVAIQHKTDI